MDNRAGELQVFVRVVEAGSFSAASRQMSMTPSTVSKLVARIEARLGVRLIERSTRHLSLTDDGRLYYERAQGLIAELEEMERQVAQGGRHARGVVRVNASVAFGVHGLEPLLPGFWRDHPDIVVDLSLSDEIVDLYLDRTDIAFRVGRLQDSALTARKVGRARRKIVASAAYLERYGVPRDVEDLDRHNCLGFNFRRSVSAWPARADRTDSGRLPPGVLRANNGETLRRMAIAGVGLARLADYHVRADIAHDRLVEVLAAADIADDEDIHAVYPGASHMPLRVRAFLDFVIPPLRAFLASG